MDKAAERIVGCVAVIIEQPFGLKFLINDIRGKMLFDEAVDADGLGRFRKAACFFQGLQTHFVDLFVRES
jgi:hypothetical protein